MEVNKEKPNWLRITFILGVILLLAGTLDPLEGSIVISAGSTLIALSAYLTHDRHRNIFIASAILILAGVCALFYLSSLGGFGGSSSLSWWWGAMILPYPLGWLAIIVTLIIRLFRKNN
jgi:hypothetical protein